MFIRRVCFGIWSESFDEGSAGIDSRKFAIVRSSSVSL